MARRTTRFSVPMGSCASGFRVGDRVAVSAARLRGADHDRRAATLDTRHVNLPEGTTKKPVAPFLRLLMKPPVKVVAAEPRSRLHEAAGELHGRRGRNAENRSSRWLRRSPSALVIPRSLPKPRLEIILTALAVRFALRSTSFKVREPEILDRAASPHFSPNFYCDRGAARICGLSLAHPCRRNSLRLPRAHRRKDHICR